MSEEEKKAIKDFLELREIHSNDSMTISYLSIYQNAVKKMLNLVEKQQKEIETWKETENDYEHELLRKDEEIENLTNFIEAFQELKKQKRVKELICEMSKFQNEFISKDKIREKIKNIEDIYKKEMKPYQTEYGLNVSLLSKKEKQELINKRNGLLMQKITLEELLEEE